MPSFVVPSTCSAVGATRELVWHQHMISDLDFFLQAKFKKGGGAAFCTSEEECKYPHVIPKPPDLYFMLKSHLRGSEGQIFFGVVVVVVLGHLKQISSILHESLG